MVLISALMFSPFIWADDQEECLPMHSATAKEIQDKLQAAGYGPTACIKFKNNQYEVKITDQQGKRHKVYLDSHQNMMSKQLKGKNFLENRDEED